MSIDTINYSEAHVIFTDCEEGKFAPYGGRVLKVTIYDDLLSFRIGVLTEDAESKTTKKGKHLITDTIVWDESSSILIERRQFVEMLTSLLSRDNRLKMDIIENEITDSKGIIQEEGDDAEE